MLKVKENGKIFLFLFCWYSEKYYICSVIKKQTITITIKNIRL